MHERVMSQSIEGASVQPANLLLGALEEELAGIDLGNARLNRRAQRVLGQLGAKPSASIPAAGARRARRTVCSIRTASRPRGCSPRTWHARAHARVLCIEDTSKMDDTPEKGRVSDLGPLNDETRWGLSLHPPLAVTPERVPGGVLKMHCRAREPGRLGQEQSLGPAWWMSLDTAGWVFGAPGGI